jgi:hypothetical protein
MGTNEKGRLGEVSKAAQVALHQDLHTSLLKWITDFGSQAFEGEGDTFWGISSQLSQDRLIGIEPHFRGATIGDAVWGPQRSPN